MTTKEWLSRAYIINSKLDKALERQHRAYTAACSTTSKLSTDPIHGSKCNSSEIKFIKYAECVEASNELTDKLCAVKKELAYKIYNIKDVGLRVLLYERYVNFMEWKRIAELLHVNENTVRGKMHGKALKILSEFL